MSSDSRHRLRDRAGSVRLTPAVLLGNGNGTFQRAVNYGTGTNPISVTVGAVNGDGKPDLAAANFYSADVSILLASAGSPVIPEAPSPILLPLTGLAAVGLVLMHAFRSGSTIGLTPAARSLQSGRE